MISKNSEVDKRNINLLEGKPARSHFPWSDQERNELIKEFKINNDVSRLALLFERSNLAIAVQLEKLNLISDAELLKYRE